MESLVFRNGTVSINDIFASSWGYEQTNICFYQVVSIHGKSTVCVRPIDSEVIYVNANSYEKPIPDSFLSDDVFKRRVKDFSNQPSINIDDCETAYKTDPTKKHRFTTYA
ncbi:TPA: hypothetical protein ACF5HI_004614 [Salmonella enterica]